MEECFDEELEKRMWKRAEMIERAIRYAVLIVLFAAAVALGCYIAASACRGGGRDPWNGSIDTALKNLKQGGNTK